MHSHTLQNARLLLLHSRQILYPPKSWQKMLNLKASQLGAI